MQDIMVKTDKVYISKALIGNVCQYLSTRPWVEANPFIAQFNAELQQSENCQPLANSGASKDSDQKS